MPSHELVRASGVTKVFGGARRTDPVTVLDGISLTVRPGELVAVVGPSGSGKSTLLYCLSGLEPCTGGSVVIEGTDLAGLSREQLAVLRQRSVGFIFQAYNLIPSLSAWENLALPLRLGASRFAPRIVDEALAAVGMTDHARRLPGQLSGGQQQRIAIARVLACEPRVVFADEPTGALDTQTGAAVLALLRAVATAERSVVMVTHDVEYAALADRVLVLRDGAIHQELRSPTPGLVLAAMEQATAAVVATPVGFPEGSSDVASGRR